jgi:hypothetical protein
MLLVPLTSRLLDSRAGGIEQPDDGLAVAQSQLPDPGGLELLADSAHGAGHDREVVGDDPDLPAVDESVPGDHPVRRSLLGRGHLIATQGLLVCQQSELDEGISVVQQLEALTDVQLSPIVLAPDLLRAAHLEVALLTSPELLDSSLELVDHAVLDCICWRAGRFSAPRLGMRGRAVKARLCGLGGKRSSALVTAGCCAFSAWGCWQ